MTGSITSVKSDVFESRSVENAQQALQGKAPGVQVLSSSAAPGSSPSIRIRGFSSNNSGRIEPLYVVDGLKVSDISYLDPSSIESMEILKDGASAAIYGVEAGNGVVLITTKKGKKGDGRIFYDFTYGITSLARKADLMNAEQYVAYQTAAGNSQSLPRGTVKPIPTGSTCFTATTVRSSAIRPASKWPTTIVRFSFWVGFWQKKGFTSGKRNGLRGSSFHLSGNKRLKMGPFYDQYNREERSGAQQRRDGESNLGNSNQFINPYGMDPCCPLSGTRTTCRHT